MKKWMFVFTALFVAIGAYAQNLKSYIPADAMIVGAANGTAIMESKFIRNLIFIPTQKTMEDILKEKGETMEQAKKRCGIAFFFLQGFVPIVQRFKRCHIFLGKVGLQNLHKILLSEIV